MAKSASGSVRGWALGLVSGVGIIGAAIPAVAKSPEPIPEAELTRCVESARMRLWEMAASNEAGVSNELTAVIGQAGLFGVALDARAGAGSTTEIVFAFNQAPRVGQAGTFGALPVTVTSVRRSHATAKVTGTLDQARAQRTKDRTVKLVGDGAGENETLSSWTLPAAYAGGMAVSQGVVNTAVEAMSAAGGLPWIAWADQGGKPRKKRVKVQAVEGDQGGWVPLEGGDSAMHPLWVIGLDLEKTGSPYLFIAMNDSPVSDTTEVWRLEKSSWKKVATAGGNLSQATREADGSVSLKFENYLDTSVWRFDPGTRKITLGCSLDDSGETTGGDGTLNWSAVFAPEGARKLEGGADTVPLFMAADASEPDTQLARGTAVWRLRSTKTNGGGKTYVAVVSPDPKKVAKGLRSEAARVLMTGWVPTNEFAR